MESELRSLIGKYGMRAVHEGLMKEMRDTFQYLQCVFEMKNEIVTPPVFHSVPTIEVVRETIPEGISPDDSTVEADSLAEEETPKDPTIKEITIATHTTPKVKPVTSTSSTNSDTDKKKKDQEEHKKIVAAKRHELLVKGVKPESLLTEDALRKWIGDGWSYMKIAKETGVHEVQVGNTAKSFGLQSNTSRYIAMKKKK